MDIYPKPHSREWFVALEAFNPVQALHTRQIIERAGRSNVCSVCGDDPARDYRSTTKGQPVNAVASIRLCDECLTIRRMNGETYVLL